MYKTVEKKLRACAKKNKITADGEKIQETIQAVDKILYENGLCEAKEESAGGGERPAGQKQAESENMSFWAGLVQKYGKRRIVFVADAVCLSLLVIVVCAVYRKLQNGGGEKNAQIAAATQAPENKERQTEAPKTKEQRTEAPKETQPAPTTQEDKKPSEAPVSDLPATEAAPVAEPQSGNTVLAEGNQNDGSMDIETNDTAVTVANDLFAYSVLIDGKEYGSAGVTLGNGLLGSAIGEIEMTIKEWDENAQALLERSVICDIHEITGLDSECAVTVTPREGKYAASNQVFIRSDYQPETWGEFKRVCNFNNLVTINQKSGIDILNAQGLVVADCPAENFESVWQQLQAIPDESAVVTDERFLFMDYSNGVTEELTIGVDEPLLGVENHAVNIYDTGYLFTNILGGHLYYIGTDAADEMIRFVKERSIVYDEPIQQEAYEY